MRRTTTALALTGLAVALVSAVPAEAAKKKPKPITGSYDLALPPDPSKDATSVAGEPGCSGLNPASIDKHAFTVPAAGTLTVDLKGQDPVNAGAGFDWDLYLNDDLGIVAESDGQTGTESVSVSFKKKTPVTFEVCNLNGTPSATVSFTFTYKK